MKPYFLLCCCYLLLGTIVVLGYRNKKQFNYPSETFYKVYGIDASHHQGTINWRAAGSQTKYKFAYLKATEALTFKDKRFVENYDSAKKAGFTVGGYHFWSLCKSAEDQFNNLRSVVPRAAGDLIPALDIESSKSCEHKKPVGVLVDEMTRVNQLFLKHYGVLPLIYTTSEFSRRFPELLNLPNKFWFRSLVGPPLFNKDWVVWQYYSVGSVPGFEGPVDLNVLNSKILFESILQR